MTKKHWEYESAKIAKAKYDRETTTQLKMKLNNNTDADILEWLDSLDNKQGYLKSLIRADISKNKGKD